MIKLGEVYKDRCGSDVRIICVDKQGNLPIVGIVNTEGCDKGYVESYTFEGKYLLYEDSEYDLILTEDFRTYKIDEPVMVRDNDEEEWLHKHFAGVKEDKPCTWNCGTTSWSVGSPEDMFPWNQCRRPTKEELGEVK